VKRGTGARASSQCRPPAPRPQSGFVPATGPRWGPVGRGRRFRWGCVSPGALGRPLVRRR
jgi:hypothetical protein